MAGHCCVAGSCARSQTHTLCSFQPSPGNKQHSLSHWPRSVTGFFHSLRSLPLRSGGTRCLWRCCGCARAPGLGRIGTGLCAQWIPRTFKKKKKKKTEKPALVIVMGVSLRQLRCIFMETRSSPTAHGHSSLMRLIRGIYSFAAPWADQLLQHTCNAVHSHRALTIKSGCRKLIISNQQ